MAVSGCWDWELHIRVILIEISSCWNNWHAPKLFHLSQLIQNFFFFPTYFSAVIKNLITLSQKGSPLKMKHLKNVREMDLKAHKKRLDSVKAT